MDLTRNDKSEADGPVPPASPPEAHRAHATGRPWAAVIGALGIVYGDIGTSPLYTMRQAFGPSGLLAVNPDNVLGILSLIFWSLVLVVTVKYVTFILRADNRGEGGVLALATLALTGPDRSRRHRRIVLMLAMAGLALFYGDGLITPAISVLSAVEGIELVAPQFDE
jgi:KUP system potassium uptake protein